jgi:exopolysaccharide biosynthesis polyprenyl glycosylphosphotransferase
MKSNASIIYNVFLAIGDFLALIAAFVSAYILRVSLSNIPITHEVSSFTYLKIFLILLPFWILIFALLGLYNSNIYERRFSELGRLLIGSFIGLLFVIFYNFLSVKSIFPAKLVPIYGFGLGFIFLVLFRNIARAVRTLLFGYDVGITNIIIVGNTAISDELRQSLRDSRKSGYRILAVVGDKRRLYHADFNDFQEALTALQASSNPPTLSGIIQTELYSTDERNREILDYAQEHHVSYRFIPGNTELFVGNIDVELFRSSVPVIAVRQTALFGWGRVVKRLSDLIFGSILLILSSPLWLIIALCMKLAEPNAPVFYKAKRFSRFGSVVRILKFRTMKQAYNNMTPEEGFRKMGRPELIEPYRRDGDQLKDDPRIGRLGKLLRATSLDELPQLFNVVHGEISLVGPRALDVFELDKFSKKNLILSVKSGLTGLAVVSGRSGISFEERRKLDLYYVQNWSFWLDLIILAKTLRVVYERLWRRGVRY